MSTATMRSTVIELPNKLLLSLTAHGPSAPSQPDWDRYLEQCAAIIQRAGNDMTRIRALAITDGGAPNAKQRDAVQKALDNKPVRMVVMTESRFARGVVTALGWINPHIKPFSPYDVAAAFAFLGIDSASKDSAIAGLAALSNEFGCDALKLALSRSKAA
jgi:hypothetical protein